ncbi:MAG: hypothetical protein KDC71_04620, partial [Acidobacteria bacterium]|nr:hypothetical protein [Acidobacteriota bacterium]
MWFLLLLWVSGPKNTIDPELLHALKARSIGPAGMSGRVTALAVPSHLPETLYLGAATGGVWKSTNGGLSFQPIFDDQPVHAIGAIAVHEQVNDHVWVGTGEGNVRNSTSIGAGVFRSLDGGKTWSCVGLEKTERINKILLHPQSTQTAYIAAMGQLWGENEERGVYRTTNGGASWSPVLQVNPSTGATDLAMDPQNPDKLFAALWQFRRWPHFFKSGGPGSGLYLTYDGGNNWKKLGPEQGLPDGELGRIAVAIAPSNHQIVYALIESKQSGLYKSEDGGQHFTLINSKSDIADRPFYYHRIVVDPQDAHRVYLVQTLVRVSEDGGKSFQTLSGASWPNIHVDYHAMWVDPLHPNRMYVGNDGGVAESRDYGKSFRFISNLPLAQFYHIHFDMDQPYHLYGGLQDNGSWRGPSATNRQGGIRNHLWELVSFGDGFDTVPDPQDSTKGYSMSQGGNLYRWDIKDGSSQVIMPAAPDGTKLRFNWNSGLALDPFQPGTLYYGSQFVHKSTDKGATWQTISPDLTTNTADWQKQDESGGLTIDVTAAENYTTLVTIAPSPIKEGLIWVGSDDGRIHVTQDGGTTWTSVESGLKGVGK